MYPCHELTEPRFPLTPPEARPFAAAKLPNGEAPYSPQVIYDAYALRNDPNAGKGLTIATVVAFSNEGLQSDFDAFNRRFDLPSGQIDILYLSDSRHYVSGWATEAASDTQWAHAAAPAARILCVFTPNAQIPTLFEGVMAAVEQGADIVSMSWGAVEFSGQNTYSEQLKQTGRIFVASAGDSGGTVLFPSSSDAVISVGGTTLYRGRSGEVFARSAWQYGGGGPSKYTGIPDWQSRFAGIADKSGAYRATPDVALDAGIKPGYAVCNRAEGGLLSIGGTSLSAPVFAGICARILQKDPERYRGDALIQHLYTLAGGTSYHEPQYYFHDITVGSNGRFDAEKGFDLCTGLGSPIGETILRNS